MTENWVIWVFIIAILSNDNHRFPFVSSLPVFLLIVSVYCLCIEVEEVKRRLHCLMFSSAGSQAQTYFVNFDTLADYQRWQRQASKVRDNKRVCCCVCRTQCVRFVCFLVSPSGLVLKSESGCWGLQFCLSSRPIRNRRLSECVWLAPQRQTLSSVWLWLNSIPRFT